MILVIDDDNSIRFSIGLMLKQAGFEYSAVATEDEALQAVRAEAPELVILDMNLTLSTTGSQGIEILRKIRILAPDTPVIMLSAWPTVPLAVEGMGYGAVDFVSKPWSNRDFMAKIRKALATVARKEESEQPHTLADIEKDAIIAALRQADNNLSAAAQALGITRQSLYRRMEKYGILQ